MKIELLLTINWAYLSQNIKFEKGILPLLGLKWIWEKPSGHKLTKTATTTHCIRLIGFSPAQQLQAVNLIFKSSTKISILSQGIPNESISLWYDARLKYGGSQPLGNFLSFLAGNRAYEGMGRPRGLRRLRKTHLENILPSPFWDRDPRYPKGGP